VNLSELESSHNMIYGPEGLASLEGETRSSPLSSWKVLKRGDGDNIDHLPI
jgi:hypothetical protein